MITAVVTNHNYERYLKQCIDSAILYCDEILVYDDGSTDGSMELLSTYGDKIKVTHQDAASGDPVWGSNLGIQEATGDYLIFLDADNWLLRRPPETGYDYTVVELSSYLEDEFIKVCAYSNWDVSTPKRCLKRFVDNHGMPFPWGGIWKTDFIKDLRWRRWRGTSYAADFRTAVDWCLQAPRVTSFHEPTVAYRKHAGQWTAVRGEPHDLWVQDVNRVAQELKAWL